MVQGYRMKVTKPLQDHFSIRKTLFDFVYQGSSFMHQQKWLYKRYVFLKQKFPVLLNKFLGSHPEDSTLGIILTLNMLKIERSTPSGGGGGV